jgi:glutathione S-transferase
MITPHGHGFDTIARNNGQATNSKDPVMPALTLYHASPSRSSVVLWMLEEVGEPYDIKLIKLSEGDNLKPDYLGVNPLGKVPALKHGDSVITEVAAICAYLADEFPAQKLNVPVGTPRRGVYLKWLFFAPSVMEPAANDKVFPRKEAPRASAIGYRDLDTVLDVVAKAVTPGPFLMGDQFTAADVVLGSLLRWGLRFKFVPERKEFLGYVARLNARPAAQRAAAKDQAMSAA